MDFGPAKSANRGCSAINDLIDFPVAQGFYRRACVNMQMVDLVFGANSPDSRHRNNARQLLAAMDPARAAPSSMHAPTSVPSTATPMSTSFSWTTF